MNTIPVDRATRATQFIFLLRKLNIIDYDTYVDFGPFSYTARQNEYIRKRAMTATSLKALSLVNMKILLFKLRVINDE